MTGKHKGTPSWDSLSSKTTTVTYNDPVKGKRFALVLNIQAMFDAKIEAVNDSENRMEGDYKDIPDLVWLCENRQDDVGRFARQLRATRIDKLEGFSGALMAEYWGVDIDLV